MTSGNGRVAGTGGYYVLGKWATVRLLGGVSDGTRIGIGPDVKGTLGRTC